MTRPRDRQTATGLLPREDDMGAGSYRLGISAEDAAEACTSLAKASRQFDLPTPQEIALMRMDLLRQEYGLARFVMPEWWRWLWISVTPSAK